MLTYLDISLFESPAQTLVNIVNTVGVMGKGIAADFKRIFPGMFKEYRELCERKELEIGKLFIYRTANKIIVNFPTKRHWREKSHIEYIKKGLEKFSKRYLDYGISSVSFPQLGCGHGELDWEMEVQLVMESFLKKLPIPVYIHLYSKPAGFIPERLDPNYAREVLLERQRISTEQVWNDLSNIISQTSNLFNSTTVDYEQIHFSSSAGNSILINRDDFAMLWNILRLNGTLKLQEIPNSIPEEAAKWLFEQMKKLNYVKSTRLRNQQSDSPIEGLRYFPPPDLNSQSAANIVI